MHSIRDILREKGTTIRSIGADETVFEAIRQMAEHGIGALLVVDDDKPVGLLSERDYSRKVILRGLRSRETLVRAIMSSPLLTISPDASVQHGFVDDDRQVHPASAGRRRLGHHRHGVDRRSGQGGDRRPGVADRAVGELHRALRAQYISSKTR